MMLMLMLILRKEVKLQQRAGSRRWVGTSFQLWMFISPVFAPAGVRSRGFPNSDSPTRPSANQRHCAVISPVRRKVTCVCNKAEDRTAGRAGVLVFR